MIRSVALGDLWSLRRKPRNQLVLFNENLLAQAHRPMLFSLRCLIQGIGRERLSAVFHDHDQRALVQSRRRAGRPEQDIIFMATWGTRPVRSPSDQDVWFRLLERLCHDAGQFHVQRLYVAASAGQPEVRELFRQLGFQAYAQNHILHLSGPDWNQGTRLAAMRPQARRDHWAIHKLYGAITPHVVQQAEVRNARAWALSRGSLNSSVQERAWVFGPDDNLVAYLHLTSGGSGHAFRLLIHPDSREHLAEVLRCGLVQISDSRPVFLMLRDYQQELLSPAQELGFQTIEEQALLMKSNVISVRRSLLRPAFEPQLEPRVPAPNIAAPREDANPYA